MTKETASNLDTILGSLIHALSCYKSLTGQLCEATDMEVENMEETDRKLTYYTAYRTAHEAGELLCFVNESVENQLKDFEQIVEEAYKN